MLSSYVLAPTNIVGINDDDDGYNEDDKDNDDGEDSEDDDETMISVSESWYERRTMLWRGVISWKCVC